MKTQIIALEAHDDLISVRDRMSWAKSPRILLVWPRFEKIVLRAADLRILQEHAATLGAELGIITRRGDVRRDADRFGIPVFVSAAAAQRETWAPHPARRLAPSNRRPRSRHQLQAMRAGARPLEPAWRSGPLVRIGALLIGVLAVLAIVSLFIPSAIVTVRPQSLQQSMTLPVVAREDIRSISLAGGVPLHSITVSVSASQEARVATRSSIPDQTAHGIARFTNLSQSDLTIPKGTIIYSLAPAAVQFATLLDTHLSGNVNAVVEVPIAATRPGAQGNLPASSIQAIQGNIGLSASVTNPEPTLGGTDRMAAAPSDADRSRLRNVILQVLKTQAQGQMRAEIGAEDLFLPETLKLGEIAEETYDPPAGQPGNLLKLTLRTGFTAQYILASDISQLAEGMLNAAIPEGFAPVDGSLTFHVAGAPQADATGAVRLSLQMERKLLRQIDLARANSLVRGLSPQAASARLLGALSLAEPPVITLRPGWWPWLPLIPFQVRVETGP